jgi:hypothetical protein
MCCAKTFPTPMRPAACCKPCTRPMSLGHGPRARKSGPLRCLPAASPRAHAALPRRPGPLRDLSRACPRGALRRRSGARVFGAGVSPFTSRAEFSPMASDQRRSCAGGRRQFTAKRSVRLRSRERLVRVYSVEKPATRRLDEKSTAQNGPGSTIVTWVMVWRPRNTLRHLSLQSFSTQLVAQRRSLFGDLRQRRNQFPAVPCDSKHSANGCPRL